MTTTAEELIAIWEQHVAAEFRRRDVEEAVGTMTADAVVNHVPVLTGGRTPDYLRHFYGRYFIPQMPPDVTMTLISRTVTPNRLIDEFVQSFTHSVRMDWFLPGLEPTGKRLDVTIVVFVEFRDGKIAAERIHWDQGTVLVQLGLLDPAQFPVFGSETARKALNPDSEPFNAAIRRFVDDPLL